MANKLIKCRAGVQIKIYYAVVDIAKCYILLKDAYIREDTFQKFCS